MIRKIIALSKCCIVAGLALFTSCTGSSKTVTPVRTFPETSDEIFCYDIVNHLASPQYAGRMTATPHARKAGLYITRQFRRAGLNPGATRDCYFQNFICDKLETPAKNSSLKIGNQNFTLGRDFSPMAAGIAGSFDAPIIFAGYGVENRWRNFYDYKKVSAAGCVVMILLGEPHFPTGQSKWALQGKQTRLANLKYKLNLAKKKGAVGALVVCPKTLSIYDPIYNVLDDTAPIPAMRITRKVADKILKQAGKKQTINQIVSRVNSTGKTVNFPLGLKATGSAFFKEGRCRNVVGKLDATEINPQSAKTIVIGAHYDHLPFLGYKTARDLSPALRAGADDNASGVACLILLAKKLSKAKRNFNYIFVAFSGEEVGFYGSKHFVNRPPVPLDKIDLMINLDQIGRLTNDRILVIGSSLEAPYKNLLTQADANINPINIFPLPVKNASYWSDNAPFVKKKIDTLFFYGGFGDFSYHTRRDVPQTINYKGIVQTADLIFDFLKLREKS